MNTVQNRRRILCTHLNPPKQIFGWRISSEEAEEYLTIEPSDQLSFTAELGKEVPCRLQLFNGTDSYIAYKVLATDPNKYSVSPNPGVVLPRSTRDISVTLQPQTEFPRDLQCKDKFLLQSAISVSGDIDPSVFEDSERYIQKCKLGVVFVSPPQPLSPVDEGCAEGSSPSAPISDDGCSIAFNLRSIPKADEQALKQYPEIFDVTNRVNCKMSLEDYLTVEPSELRFTAELQKQVSCPLHLLNNTDKYIAFKAKTTHQNKYCVHPSHGVVLPRSTFDISVTMQSQREFPNDLQCKAKFLLQSSITISGDIDHYVFNQDSGSYIQECKLDIVYVSPTQPQIPIAKGSEEPSSPSTDVSEYGNSNISDLTSISKADAEAQQQYPEIMKNASYQKTTARSESIEHLLRELATDKPKHFSHEDLINFTSNWSTKLGSGAFGNVYKGQFLNVEIAVKVLVENQIVEENFIAEVSTMGRTYHRNLVKLYGFCFDTDMKALVYEYASNGSLDHVLYENRFDLKWEKLYHIAVETAKALMYLHDGCYDKIIHHDIKPANVLLDFNFSPKITDFGLAKLMSRNVNHFTMTTIRGTAGYAAPEISVPFSEITYKCDVYSFGMMLFEILGRRRNVGKEGWFPKQIWEKFKSGRLDEILWTVALQWTIKRKQRYYVWLHYGVFNIHLKQGHLWTQWP